MLAAGDLLTTDGQIEWRGLVLGAGTRYRWVKLEGWNDLPPARGGNTPHPSRHGTYLGRLLGDDRTITVELLITGPLDVFREAVAAVRAATAWTEAPDEDPLVVRLHDQTHMVMARCVRRAIPTDRHYALGLTRAAIQWVASDPRLLRLPAETREVSLQAPPAGGMRFPLVFPLRVGAGGSGGEATLVTTGNAPAWPLYHLRGPVPGPVIDLGGSILAFDPGFVVPAGQTLVIDTRHQAVTIDGTDLSRADRLWTRQWAPIPPGTSTRVRFFSAAGSAGYSPDARLTVTWHHTDL
ncbi:hypothetical protein LX15_004808 [Streptoalloteichus tenebrarius]|uniref:Phage tail protein n=1 Tax=Streptoalloteichus tenebrarius (strain ATCC 17920 / DSM 40477 / JCM 4838 / CBS 697.72 / NBRC 16177 / NCIMB 11028 / NRRL B-12390 / A12253. 1 / ISP 5477) TaxID=1933 RepID=A0ABT1HZY2_STRSD|nr:hypothetical protein [Streptoalloteichus tenebrarius]MCP2261088.1 hypothetical protein [Streptoalloteichus tenebrarius]BFF03116.1 hypothetical protein GCM10020241_47910 [Streptoalloteichus tenebrarius]